MANNCYTMYRIIGDEADIKRMNNDFEQVAENHKDNSPRWLKHIATDILDYSEDDIFKHGLHVRGTWESFYEDEIDTDTAWSPCDELFDLLADKYDVRILWMADERGCCGIWSNDADNEVWDWTHVIYNNEDCEEENFSDASDAIDWCNEYLKEKGMPTITSLAELDDSEIFSVTEVEYSENF